MIWNILGVIAIIGLIAAFFRRSKDIWQGLTIGVVLGLIGGLVGIIYDSGFDWQIFKRLIIISVLFGIGAEIVSRLRSKRIKG